MGFEHVILFCRVILYCRMWTLVFSFQTSTFVFRHLSTSLKSYAIKDTFFITSLQDSKLSLWQGCFHHSSVLGAEISPEMPRNMTKAVLEGNGPVPHNDEFGCGEPMMVDLYRMLKNNFDRMDNNLDRMLSHLCQQDKTLVELTEEMRAINQRLADLEYEARQSRLATEADVEPDTKTRKRTEDTAIN